MTTELLSHALHAGHRGPALRIAPLGSALVVGAGGVLGSALLAEALVAGRFSFVRAAVEGPLTSAMRGFEPWPAQDLDADGAANPGDTAFIVFERGLAPGSGTLHVHISQSVSAMA